MKRMSVFTITILGLLMGYSLGKKGTDIHNMLNKGIAIIVLLIFLPRLPWEYILMSLLFFIGSTVGQKIGLNHIDYL